MVKNSDFNFADNATVTLELPFSEHIEELRQRFFHIFWIILFTFNSSDNFSFIALDVINESHGKVSFSAYWYS